MGKLSWLDDAVKGAARNLDEAARKIRVYHGTPHRFPAERLVEMPDGTRQWLVGDVDQLPDIPEGAVVVKDAPLGRFRMDKIGSGEGAQAYGHGLYTAESKGTAQWYRENLVDTSDYKFYIGDVEMRPDSDAARVAYDIDTMGVDGARASYVNAMRKHDYDQSAHSTYKQYENYARLLEEKGPSMRMERSGSIGSVYTSEIPDGDYLLWDKPLSEQPESVQKAVLSDLDQAIEQTKEALKTASDRRFPVTQTELRKHESERSVLLASTGKEIHDRIANVSGGQQSASEVLRSTGIPGIKYLDGTSRSAGEGAYNYVLFDEDLIDIKERGKIDPRLLAPIGAVGAGAMAAQQYDFGTPDYDAKIQEFRNRRAAKSQIWKELKEAGATIASAIPAGIISDAYRIGGYLSPVTPVEETERGAEIVQNALMYTPEGGNRYLNEFARQVNQFGQDVEPLVNAWKQTPIYRGYKQLPQRIQGLIRTASDYAF